MSRKKNKRKKRKLSSSNKRLIKRNIPLDKFPFNIGGELNKAVQYHQSGQLQKAEEIYRRILEVDPTQSDSLHLLGVIAHQAGKSDIAVNLINRAIQNNPKNPVYYNNLGYVFKGQGKLNEAISCCQRAVNLKPDYAEAYYNLGYVFQDQGKLNEAISCYEKALELKPDYAEAYHNLGYVFKGQGKLNEAISCYEKALEIRPDYAGAHNNMGNMLQDQGKLDEAILCYQKALEIEPDCAEAYHNMGNAFKDQGKLNEAISCYEKALELKSDCAEAYNNMGNAFQDQGKLNEAISCYEKALEIESDCGEAYNNMGNAFRNQGKLDEAISCYQKAMKLKPDFAGAYNNMGNVFQDQDKLNEAISYYEKALEIEPEFAQAHSELVCQLQRTCAWRKLEGMTAKLNSLTGRALDNGTKTAESPFVSLMRHTDLSRYFAVAKSWSCDIARMMSGLKIPFSFDDRELRKTRITIGYLSNDFRNHPKTHLMLDLFGLHNRDEFKIICYSDGEDDGTYYRKRIQQDCDKFVDLRNLNHADAAKCIYEDQVDILIDLNGYTGGNRLQICALRPAPVQARYLGLAGTTGADFFDYIITDRIVTPEDHAQYYSENFVYLPHCYQINSQSEEISNKDWKKTDFGLPEGSFVFCSFNQGYKIEPVMFNSWMKILRQVSEGVLWLQQINETAEKNLRQEAEARGVNPARLIFAERLSKGKHLARLRLADLALDTRIVSGAATTSDALRVGVPVITLQGGNFASRMSSSILTAIGLPELIVHSLEEYEDLAVRLALNPDETQTIRRRLANNRLSEPLFDTSRFAGNLEKAYKEMWDLFLAGERPQQIDVVESSTQHKREARDQWSGQPFPQLPGTVERGYCHRVCQDDHNPARFSGKLQGYYGNRPDAGGTDRPEAIINYLK